MNPADWSSAPGHSRFADGLFSLFQPQICHDDLAAGRKAADLSRDVRLFAGRRFGQPPLEHLKLLLAMTPLSQFSVPLNHSAHRGLLPFVASCRREFSKLTVAACAVNAVRASHRGCLSMAAES